MKTAYFIAIIKEVTYLTGDKAVKRMEFLHEKWEMDRISDINYAKKLGIEEGKLQDKLEGKKRDCQKITRTRCR